MPGAPPDPLVALDEALCDEVQARELIREAQARQAEALGELRSAGVPYSIVVVRVARLRGSSLTLQMRRRLSALLRKRKSRVTHRHRKIEADPPHGQLDPLRSAEKEVHTMGRIVKRKIVETEETFHDEEELEGEELDSHDEEPEEEDPDEAKPRRKRK